MSEYTIKARARDAALIYMAVYDPENDYKPALSRWTPGRLTGRDLFGDSGLSDKCKRLCLADIKAHSPRLAMEVESFREMRDDLDGAARVSEFRKILARFK